MLYRIGTACEISTIPLALPQSVRKELFRTTSILDAEYGSKRNYLETGGYSLIVETKEDISKVREIIDYTLHPPEWVERFDSFIVALYLSNDDFGIMLFIPMAIAPKAILDELEDN